MPEPDSYDRLFFEFERTEPRLSYMVCSVPRSGSSLLCELLSGTGVAGAPAEFLHPDKRAALSERWGAETLHEYVSELLARKTSPNGVFGIKAHWGQYNPAFGETDPREVFPGARVVLITRRDRLRQAISWVRALQTNKWSDQDRPRVQRPAEFDYEHIERKLRRIDREERLWEALCRRYGITPHRAVYEDLIEDREQVVRSVLEAVGVDVPGDLQLPAPVLGPQADDVSDEWVERYQAEAAKSPKPRTRGAGAGARPGASKTPGRGYTWDRLFFEFEPTEPRLVYLVCSVPRSGSSLLCELLTATGIAGAPHEFLNRGNRGLLSRRWSVETLDEYMRELLPRKTSPNGVFGIKVHWGQYNAAFGEADPREVFPAGHVVLMTRRDRLRQAISWVRALQTKKWSDQDTPRIEGSAQFDYEHITRKLRRIEHEERGWESLFERCGITPHEVVYEDLVADREQVVRSVLDAVGVDVPADLQLPAPVLGRLADELSDQWVERYLAEAATSPRPARGGA